MLEEIRRYWIGLCKNAEVSRMKQKLKNKGNISDDIGETIILETAATSLAADYVKLSSRV